MTATTPPGSDRPDQPSVSDPTDRDLSHLPHPPETPQGVSGDPLSELLAELSTDPAVPHRRPQHRRRRPLWLTLTAAALSVVVLIPTFSFLRAVVGPANLSTTEKAAERRPRAALPVEP